MVKVGLIFIAGLAVVSLFVFLAKRRREAHEIGPQRDSRGLRKKEPFFRREIVERKIRDLFPTTAPSQILALLDVDLPGTFGVERLQLAP